MAPHQFDAMMRLLNITYAVISDNSGVWRYTSLSEDKFELMRNGRASKMYRRTFEEELPKMVQHGVLQLNQGSTDGIHRAYDGRDRRVG